MYVRWLKSSINCYVLIFAVPFQKRSREVQSYPYSNAAATVHALLGHRIIKQSNDLVSTKQVFVPSIRRMFPDVYGHIKEIADKVKTIFGDSKFVEKRQNNISIDKRKDGKYNVQNLLTYKILRVN